MGETKAKYKQLFKMLQRLVKDISKIFCKYIVDSDTARGW